MNQQATPPVPLARVLREWGRIGCVGFGGPSAHIRLLRQLCVERRGYLDAREFEDAIAVGNLLPGPASTQLAIFCAWRLRGRAVAFTPSFLFVLLGGPRFEQIRGNTRARAFLNGAGPAAIGAILGSAITLTRELTHPWQYAVLAGALVLLLPLRRGVVLTLLSGAAIGVTIALAAGTVAP